MARAKRGVTKRAKHKKWLKLAKGYRGAKSKLYRQAREQVQKSLQYAYRDRRVKKRVARSLWITRINAACRSAGLTYSQFIRGLKNTKVDIDRKILSDLAINDPEVFSRIVALVKE